MQHDQQRPAQSIRRPARLIKYPTAFIPEHKSVSLNDLTDIAMQATALMEPVPSHPVTPAYSFQSIPEADLIDDISSQSTYLMRLSGMMRAVRIPPQQQQAPPGRAQDIAPTMDEPAWKGIRIRPEQQQALAGRAQGIAPTMDEPAWKATSESGIIEEEYWPNGIQQTGPLPVINLYGSEPFGRTLPLAAIAAPQRRPEPAWKTWLNTPVVKVAIGLLIGVGLLYLDSKFVNIAATIKVLQQNLATARGISLALLSGVAFLTAFSVRGIRWKLFLNPIGRISTFKAVQLFLVGIFLNFLLPVRGGEVAKSLMLKRIANIPVSKSLPTVAMDKALDLLPALLIMAIVPFLGVAMDIKLWLILGAVGGLLVGLIFFTGFAAWKRAAAIALLHKMTGILPEAIGSKIAGFATGFVDSLLLGASRPKIFLPAVLLTCVAVIFDGLFAMLAFWTIGFPISFGTAIFGYTVYNMFYILPTPPGQVGSNEVAGMLVFNGLLGLPADKVTAMFVFSHPWAALLMSTTGMICLSALGLTISSAMKVQAEQE